MTTDKMKALLLKAQGRAGQIKSDKEKASSHIKELKSKALALEGAQAFLQSVAQETQEQLRYHIEDIVQLALDTCFPDQYTFRINFQVKYGKTEAALDFIDKSSGISIDPINASGGGVVDLAAFALRIAGWTLENNTDNVIILDEPLKFISADLRIQAAKVLQTLSHKLNLQFIMVTHLPEFTDVADKVFMVKKNKKGISIVKES
jgi:DNA repair exonuclease SbcCD ATPase subunit